MELEIVPPKWYLIISLIFFIVIGSIWLYLAAQKGNYPFIAFGLVVIIVGIGMITYFLVTGRSPFRLRMR